ncbi:MAG: DivIVA domain-containing protein [Solirubrobacterales bacterium]|nr:DivIVA domain-containing protein [Solirubrobacterales bacterium]
MALDRQSIEKKDFPIGRRGYDPDAVDAHLRALADEIEELTRSARRSESLAAAASEQVRSIVEAAETTAADIQRQAEGEAREIRGDANSEAEAARRHATAEARDYVDKVAQSTTGMLERIDGMENELAALIESVRSRSNRLNADLQLLEGSLASVKHAVVPGLRSEPEHAVTAAGAEVAAAPAPAVEQAPAPSPAVERAVAATPAVEWAVAATPAVEQAVAAAPAPAVERAAPAVPMAEPFEASAGILGSAAGEVLTESRTQERAAEPRGPGPADGTEDESARLVALNMVMKNTPREEIERYLAEHFRLTDRGGLLDDVYSSFQS